MEIKNFAIIEGKSTKIVDGKMIYKPLKAQRNDSETSLNLTKAQPIDTTLIRSDTTFANGYIEFKVNLKSVYTGILAIFTSSDNKEIRCGYSRTYSQFIISLKDNPGWKILSSAGDISNYDLNKDINFKIELNGSHLNLLINNILLCSATISIKDMPLEFRFSSDESFTLFDIKKHGIKPTIFVVMQFSNEYNELYEEVIKPVTERFGYDCVRADEYYTGTPILTDIIKSIQESNAIIAEITPDNPNVFYEIGYSHAIGKPTILLCDKKRDKLPFDLSGFRTLFYENTIAGKKKVENSLSMYLENI